MVQLIKLGEHSHKPLEEGDLIAPEHIELSGEEGNALRREDDGLYVPEASSGLPEGGQEGQFLESDGEGGASWSDIEPGGLTEVATEDSDSVGLVGSGSGGSPLKAELKINTVEGNRLENTPDGLTVSSELPAETGSDGQLLTSDGEGGVAWADAPDTSVSVADTLTVALTGDGSDGSPIKAAVQISAGEGNLLSAEGDGLMMESPLPEGGQEDQLLQMGPDGGAVWADLTDLLPAAPLNPEDLPVALGLDEQGNLVWHKIGC